MKTREWTLCLLLAALCALSFEACSEPSSGGTNTNWIVCQKDVDCPAGDECIDGRCRPRAGKDGGSGGESGGDGAASGGAGTVDATDSDSGSPASECLPLDCSDGSCTPLTWPIQCEMADNPFRMIIYNWRVVAGCGYVGTSTELASSPGPKPMVWYDAKTGALVGSQTVVNGIATCYGAPPTSPCEYKECSPCPDLSKLPPYPGCNKAQLGLE